MKQIILFLLALSTVYSQTDYNLIKESDRHGLYFMYYDSSAAKSTIVEFEDFVVLIEAPIKNEGGGAKELKDHETGGEKIIRTLKKYFPGKPLKYFLHSHWHPHSISSINPFLRSGVKVVTTAGNYNVIKRFTDTVNIEGLQEKLIFVQDSLEISDTKNSLTAYRLTQKDYPSVPTEDYLYFYFKSINVMHCACMYFKWEGESVEGKELLTAREEDLHKFLLTKNLRPDYLLRYNKEKTEISEMMPIEGLENVIKNGIRSADISNKLLSYSQTALDDSSDVVISYLVGNNIPGSMVNSTVYSLLRKKELQKANSFAKIQAMINPSDPNSWDTLGETYYFLGNMELAKYYEKQTKKVSPQFNSGGMEEWEKDLEDYSKIWQNLSK